ncbi:MAG: dihydroneopterin aldolase [Myxococcota bacterium]|nr:dihydroneopterin aldolase [Myxococcota bacterium]
MSGLDKIYIRDLAARCIIGFKGWEREKKQDVLINIALYADLSTAGKSDQVADTIDYKQVKHRVLDMVEGTSFFLIERLAEAIAARCLEDARVKRVDVIVDKPGALRFARSVAVEIARYQEGTRPGINT